MSLMDTQDAEPSLTSDMAWLVICSAVRPFVRPMLLGIYAVSS